MKTDPSSPVCPRCGGAISPEAPQGLCPRCVLRGAATSTEPAAGASLRAAPDLEAVRAAFPQLEIQGLIGQGGMGFVYAARQSHLDRRVALKLLPVAADSDPAFAERFAREGRLLARLNHPNIVSVYEFGQAPGFGYLLMEYVDGVNLRQAMRSGRFSPSEALAIVPKICEALQYAHDQGVLHRDIKPENILLDARGRVKIADFGIAKLAGDRHPDPTLTASGARLGTPHYMAPEQIEAPSGVDHRADIYSLGVVFYELLTGELPLGRFAPPSAKADLDARIDAIVMRALAKERELRQQSAGEVKTQVEGLGETGPGVENASGPAAAPPLTPLQDFEYRSSRTLFGLPLIHYVSGVDPRTGRPREARGIIAMGPRARGGLAVGGSARGIIAIGGGAFGVLAFGGMACGGVAIGGMALGLVSFGGLALALLLACGGMAVGWQAMGGMAAGFHAAGGMAFSMVPNTMPPEWQLALLRLTRWLWLPALVPALAPLAVAAWVHGKRREPPPSSPAAPRNPWPRRLFWLVLTLALLPMLTIVTALTVPALFQNGAVRSARVVMWLPLLVGAFFLWQSVRRPEGPASEGLTAEWNPWPRRIFLAVVLLVLLPLLLLAAGLLIPYLSMRQNAFGSGRVPDAMQSIGSEICFSSSEVEGTAFNVTYWSNGFPVELVDASTSFAPGKMGVEQRMRWKLQSPSGSEIWSLRRPWDTPSQSTSVRFPRDLQLVPLGSPTQVIRPGKSRQLWLFHPADADLTKISTNQVAAEGGIPAGIRLSHATAGGTNRPLWGISVHVGPEPPPSKEYEAMTRPSQSRPDSLPTFYGRLSLEIPVGQTALVTVRHWSNGVSQDLPVTNGVWSLSEGPPTPPSGFFPAGRSSQLMTNPVGSVGWSLWLFGEGDLIPVGFPKAFVPRHCQIEMRLGANTVTNVWLFPDARVDSPGSRDPRSGIEAILTTRDSIPADQRYQEAAGSLLTLRAQRRLAAGRLESLQRSRSWNKAVTPEKIEKQSADLNALDRQVPEALEKLGPLADAVGWSAGAGSSP